MLSGNHKLIAVVQPHRYSRLADLFADFCSCFNDADEVLVADIYAAGEAPIDGADKASLIAGLRDHGHKAAASLDGPDTLAAEIAARTSQGDVVMCLGAGDITAWATALPHQLDKLAGESA
jgi:UDP-N-acetylmuramate--alanine ligase